MDPVVRLRQLRTRRNLTYRQLAEQLGLSFTTVYGMLHKGFKPQQRTRARVEAFLANHSPLKGRTP
jgi:transcriptional regulator with XRE-family HTH domain